MSDTVAATERRARPTAWTPLAIPVFRAVWLASLASNIGIWLGNVGTAWLMTELRPTPIMVTLVQVATSLPVFLFALPAGAIGDMVDRRRLLIVLQIVSVALALLLGLSTACGLTTPGVILVASFLFGTTLAFGMPAFQAIVPDLVPRHELAAAVSLNSIGINVARVIGPALGGALILAWGAAAPFFVNTVFYLVVVVALLRWLPPLARAQHDSGWIVGAVLSGVRHTIGAPEMRATLIRSGGYAFFASLYFSLLPLVARDQLGGGPGIYGLLLGLPRRRRHRGSRAVATLANSIEPRPHRPNRQPRVRAFPGGVGGMPRALEHRPDLVAGRSSLGRGRRNHQCRRAGRFARLGKSSRLVDFPDCVQRYDGFWQRLLGTGSKQRRDSRDAYRIGRMLFSFDLCTLRWRIPGDEGLAPVPKGQLGSEPDRTVASRRQS